MSDGGKGSKARPYSVPLTEFDSNWDNIFGKKNEKSESPKTNETGQSSKSRGMDDPELHRTSNS